MEILGLSCQVVNSETTTLDLFMKISTHVVLLVSLHIAPVSSSKTSTRNRFLPNPLTSSQPLVPASPPTSV